MRFALTTSREASVTGTEARAGLLPRLKAVMKELLLDISKIHKNANPDRIALFIIALGILIQIPLIFKPFTDAAGGTWRQTDTASIAYHFLVNGFRILYPQIYWGGSGPGYVEAEFQLYPFIVALLYAGFGEHLWLGRLVSFVFSTLTIITFFLFARKVLKLPATLWSLILFVFSPLFLRLGTAFMPEATVMFFYVAALYLFYRWLDEQQSLLLFLASASTALAILVKPTSSHIGLIFALLAIERYGGSIVKNWRAWLAAVICVLPGVLYYWHAHNLYSEYGNTFGLLSGGDSKLGNLYYWLSPHFYKGVAGTEVAWVFTPLAVPVFLIGFFQSLRRRQTILLFSVITIGIYYLIVARYSGYGRGTQYHIYMIPFAALGFGAGIDWLASHKRCRLGVFGVLMAIASIIALVAWSAHSYGGMLRSAEPEDLIACAKCVQKLVPADSRIIVSTTGQSEVMDIPGIPIPDNYQEPMLFFYSQRYGWSLPADWLAPGKIEELRREGASYYVVFNRDLILTHPDVGDYLAASARQVGPGIESGCGIYQFEPSR